ncbi:UDP-glucuronosyl/UDP-glucosyltransferase [Parasponia andersonii]|uniref:Glycosyltransferase n=1 Tax=Parasponia andersonii TaxID=3476 RepID=A0A2P5C3Z4_PARAD|nr:UDP-glucuronosyl/UDP-glucosyltransferase [Parasponia andersonii]
MVRPRFILVTYPAQGHINPSLQFAKRLAHIGADVTFVTSLSAHRLMAKGWGREPDPFTSPNGSVVSYVPFSDGYDDGFKPGDHDIGHYMSEIRRCGFQAISDLIVSARNDGRPYSGLVYTILLPWAGVAADELRLRSVLLWIQPATVLDIYYYYFHGYGDIIKENSKRHLPSKTTLPGLSLEFTRQDLPSFMDPADTYIFAIPLFREHFKTLEKRNETRIVLVNTFDELEDEALRAVSDHLSLMGIGPLIPSAFLDEKDPSDKSFGGDLFQRSEDKYIEWLNSKPKTTVVYVSFGSMSVLSKPQMEEIANGLLDFGRPFLWVIRKKVQNDKKDDYYGDDLSRGKELEKLGMIVPWCSQVEVLSNESLGCFVTHCGWNSTLESLATGVPMVAFPQWTDQGTNAKMIEDMWKTGVRVKPNEEGIVKSGEIKRCLELVMGEKENGEEMRRNAKKWRDFAREAVKEGGSSDKNLKAFVAEMIGEGRNLCLNSYVY